LRDDQISRFGRLAIVDRFRTNVSMENDDIAAELKGLSIIARQCVAAVCLERYCRHHKLDIPELNALLDHIWRITSIKSPDGFVNWDRGFSDLAVNGLFDPIPPSVLDAVPKALHGELDQLISDTVETSAATWYASDPEDQSLAHLLSVVRTVTSYGIPLPDLNKFRSSDATWAGGWGTKPTAFQTHTWRYSR
jgi:hypothetical protein